MFPIFGGGCTVADIREVDWYKHEDRQYDYGVITYICVDANGARLNEDRHEELSPHDAGPDYTYECQKCEERFWFWSDVMRHVKDAGQ